MMFVAGTITRQVARLLLIAAVLAMAAAISPGAAEAAWRKQAGTSPLDDSATVTLSLEADGDVALRWGMRSRPHLTLRCRENGNAAFIRYGTFLSLEALPVTIRIDQDPARTDRWRVFTDFEAVGLWGRAPAIRFIRSPGAASIPPCRVVPPASRSPT